MTPAAIMAMALDNVGLGNTAGREDRARQYLNETAHAIYTWSTKLGNTQFRQPVKWLWAFKETTLALSASTRGYSLASDVLHPHEYYDTTNDRWVPMTMISTTDRMDPDEDESGDPERIGITGRDATTGYWVVDIYPTPDASTTLRYRYYAQWVDLDSDDDDTDLNAKLPDWMQPALRAGISEMYQRERGDIEMADIQRRIKEDIIARGVARNYESHGQVHIRLNRPTETTQYSVQEGSLT